MQYIQKLPFIMGASMSILIGMISYGLKVTPPELYVRMVMTLTGFFIVGIYIRSIIRKIIEEIEEKKRSEEGFDIDDVESYNGEGEFQQNSSQIDYLVDDTKDLGEDFEPLRVDEINRKDF